MDSAAFFNYDTGNPSVRRFLEQEQKEYNVFSGADMAAYIGNKGIGKIMGLTCSITREVGPVYTWGSPNIKAFVKGKRAIVGSLVFQQFDKHAILRDLFDTSTQTLQSLWDSLGNRAEVVPDQNILLGGNNNWADLVQRVSEQSAAQRRDVLEQYMLVKKRKVNYVDMIPPFDISIAMVNEAGNAAWAAIHGVQLINEAWGYTMDDMSAEVAFTYMAMAVTPLTEIKDISKLNAGQPNSSGI
jgi:hypothetical protein